MLNNLIEEINFLKAQYNAKMRKFSKFVVAEAFSKGYLPNDNFQLAAYEIHGNILLAQVQSKSGEAYQVQLEINNVDIQQKALNG